MREDGPTTRERAGTTYGPDAAAAAPLAPSGPSAPDVDWAAIHGGSTAAVAVVDRATETIVFATPAFARLHGHAPEALVGTPVAALHPAAARGAVAEAIARVDVARVHVHECDRLRADGTTFPAREHLSVDGAHRVVFVHDLSAERAVERELRARERLLRETQRVARVGSWEWDVVSNHLAWSDTICALYGVAPDSAPTTFDGYLALVHPDDRAHARAVAERAYVDRRPFAFDHRVVHADGSVRTLHGRGEVVTDAAGRVVRMLGSAEDVTERQRAAERMRYLQALSNALASALTAADVAGVIVERARDAVGSDAAFVAQLRGDGATVELLRTDGFPPDVMRVHDAFPLFADMPASAVIRSGTSIWIERSASHDTALGALGALGALAVLPLVDDGRAFGAVGFAFRRERAFEPDDRSFLGALAGQCAQALQRASLFEAERRARADAEAAQRRVAFLAEASRILGESIDYTATLQRVARTVAPAMADWCTVDLLTDAGDVTLVAIAHAEPERERWARQQRERHPIDRHDTHGLARVLRDGTSELQPAVDDAMLAAAARTPDELALLREIGCRSYVCVPLRVRDTIIGAITLLHTTESERRHDAADLALVEELARRAATAIDHARAYRAAQIANQVKSEFLAVMSHELRTPLNAIGGYAELLALELRGPVTDAQRRDLERIRLRGCGDSD